MMLGQNLRGELWDGTAKLGGVAQGDGEELDGSRETAGIDAREDEAMNGSCDVEQVSRPAK